MKAPAESPAGIQAASCDGSAANGSRLLEQEICFWRELLAGPKRAAYSSDCRERMQQALALAEYRLASMVHARNH